MKYSQSLSLLFLMLIMTPVLSQKDSSTVPGESKTKLLRYEIGTYVYGLTLRPGDFSTRYKMVWDNQAFSGLYYKRYFGKNVFRSSLEYSRRTVYFGKESRVRYSSSRGELASLELKLGYQRLLNDKRFSPFLFADAEYSYFRPLIGPIYYPLYTSSLIAPDYYYYQRYSLNGSFFSVSPGFGLRWKMQPQLIMTAEASAQFFISRERSSSYYDTYHSIGVNAKPIKLSIGYLF